jgi:AraC-like DNA-binding protein
VRAYAQRTVNPTDPCWTQSVPAQLEQILNLEFGVLPDIRHRGRDVSQEILIGGSQGDFSGTLHLRPGVESFAVFFWPCGWSQLFDIPVKETTDNFDDALSIHGAEIRNVWNRMGEEVTFERRVEIVETFLMRRLPYVRPVSKINTAITYLFEYHGVVRIPRLGRHSAVSLRQFERLFRKEVGMSPKMFARVARFQAAMDAKLASPGRTWLDIAHSFCYYDQMHMIHDFEQLGRNTPTQVLLQMGDVRPVALVSSEEPVGSY